MYKCKQIVLLDLELVLFLKKTQRFNRDKVIIMLTEFIVLTKFLEPMFTVSIGGLRRGGRRQSHTINWSLTDVSSVLHSTIIIIPKPYKVICTNQPDVIKLISHDAILI